MTPIPGKARARQIVVFLAVVWSIGMAFVALEGGLTELTQYALTKGVSGLPGQSRAAAAHCQEVMRAFSAAPANAQIVQQSPYLVWRLGNVLGYADGWLSSGAAAAPAAALIEQSAPITKALAIPRLALPVHHRAAYAMPEFTEFLESDPPCIAAMLASRYSPRHAALYKFGAAVAYSAFYHRMAPQLEIALIPQIQSYGSAAGVPAELWRPLMGKPGAGMEANVQRIDEYIRSGK